MAYPFVPAPDHWPRRAPIRAIALHHAEGGGTVEHLQKPDGNSAHYVVRYTGAIVQMVREDRAAGSIDPTKVRLNDDPPFTYLGESIVYGVTANKAALGQYWRDPNSAVIAVEIEGFARVGPNTAQRAALRSLVADIRSRHGSLPALGHRDWQNYKACPGKLIPWADYGGHGVQSGEQPVVDFDYPDNAKTGSVTIKSDLPHSYLRLTDGTLHPIGAGIEKRAVGPILLAKGTILGDSLARRTGYLIGQQAAFVLDADVVFVPDTLDVAHTVTVAVDGQEKASIQV